MLTEEIQRSLGEVGEGVFTKHAILAHVWDRRVYGMSAVVGVATVDGGVET